MLGSSRARQPSRIEDPMADQEKRLTASELRAQQEEREKEEQARKDEASEKKVRAAAEAARRQHEAVVEALRKGWYASVTKAAGLTGVRFVVLAEVIYEQSLLELLAPVTDEMKQAGYSVTFERLDLPPSSSAPKADTEISIGTHNGLLLGPLPRLGSGGEVRWYVVRW